MLMHVHSCSGTIIIFIIVIIKKRFCSAQCSANLPTHVSLNF